MDDLPKWFRTLERSVSREPWINLAGSKVREQTDEEYVARLLSELLKQSSEQHQEMINLQKQLDAASNKVANRWGAASILVNVGCAAVGAMLAIALGLAG